MPFDGVVAKSVSEELSELLTGGRVEKIFQPESDEIIIGVRSKGYNYKLLISANANYSRIQLTDATKENPMSPPMFCMLLRKHLTGGKITGFEFSDYERIITILVESATELGDITEKRLIVEIMGRYSNIILTDSNNRILDAIKHVDADISSVREIMPARLYTLPPAQEKNSPGTISVSDLVEKIKALPNLPLEKALLDTIKGFSPILCREICYRADINGKKPGTDITDKEAALLTDSLSEVFGVIESSNYSPCVIYEDKSFKRPLDFHCMVMKQYAFVRQLPTSSAAMDAYYTGKDHAERLKQRRSDLTKVIGNNIDRVKKKLAIQQQNLREVADREKLKLYGELVTANIYAIAPGTKSVSLLNYYSEDGELLDIPLNPNKSPQDNAQAYYRKYSKAKSTFTNANIQFEEATKELAYLESVMQSLEAADSTADIGEIRQELAEQGYVSPVRRQGSKKQDKPLPPLKYVSSDGFEILAGRNNRQNDVLTLKTAASYDLWLHTRNIPGSHVIIRTQKKDVSDTALLEASLIAAYHSRASNSSNVPVDFTSVKNVKKPPGAKPGMVNYEHFKTVIVTPDEEKVNKLSQK